MANWGRNSLRVEACPCDGGYALETYTVITDGNALMLEMEIHTYSFGEATDLTRVYGIKVHQSNY